MELFGPFKYIFRSREQQMLGKSPDQRAKLAAKDLKNENNPDNADALQAIKESRRIFEMTNATPVQKIRLPETRDLRFRDGTAWLNLVLALYEKAIKDQQSSILVENPDLPGEARRVLAAEMEKRDSMPTAKQKMLDAALYTIREKAIFNLEPPKAASAADPTGMDKAA